MVNAFPVAPPELYPALALLATWGRDGATPEALLAAWAAVPEPGAYELGGIALEIVRSGEALVLRNAPAVISRAEVAAFLPPALAGIPIEVVPFCDSTNERMLRGEGGCAPWARNRSVGATLAAETQLKGRGRWGRSWASPPFLGAWFSLWCPGFADAPLAVAAAGAVGAALALERAGVEDVRLLWPNDLLVAGGKAGGILVERGGGGWALGVGLNVAGDPEKYVPAPAVRPVSVGAAAAPIDRNRLLALLIEEIVAAIGAIGTPRASAIVGAWKARQGLWGRRVLLKLRDRNVVGAVEDLDPLRGIRVGGSRAWFVPREVVRLETLEAAP